MRIKILAAAAALVATAGSAGAQFIYNNGGYYGGSGTVPMYSAGYVAPGYFNNNFATRGVINAGAYNTPLYGGFTNFPVYTASAYSPFSTLYQNFGAGYNSSVFGNYNTGYYGNRYNGLYNAGYYTPGYVGGYNTLYGNSGTRGGVYGGNRLFRR